VIDSDTLPQLLAGRDPPGRTHSKHTEPAFRAGFLLAEIIRRGSGPEREKNAHMSRTNRRHNRQIELHRRNKGPEMLSQAADNELQCKAVEMVAGLSKKTIEAGDVAAAGLLVTLAEIANRNDGKETGEHAFSLAERWAKEPQVVELDSAPRLPGGTERLALTDGMPRSDDEGEKRGGAGDSSEIIDAEWEMLPAGPAPGGTSLSG
jgi:hypothetical protein